MFLSGGRRWKLIRGGWGTHYQEDIRGLGIGGEGTTPLSGDGRRNIFLVGEIKISLSENS